MDEHDFRMKIVAIQPRCKVTLTPAVCEPYSCVWTNVACRQKMHYLRCGGVLHSILNFCVSVSSSFRFGKKKDDKSKEAAKGSKSKLEALSEEELDRIPDSRDGYESDVGGIHLCVVFPHTLCHKREILRRGPSA